MSSSINTVLVTGIGGPAGAGLCRQLRASSPDIHVVGTDIRDVAKPVDAYLTGPRADSPDLIPFLQSVIARYDVDLFVPTVQDELPAVAAAIDVLDCVVVMGSLAAVATCQDKLLSASQLAAAGLGVPWTRIGTLEPARYPLVAKPRVARGGRGVSVAESPRDLPALDSAMITQGFAPGAEYCAQVYRSPIDDSVTVVVLEKTELRDGRVGNATRVARIDRAQAPDVAELAEAAARELNLYGPMDMDIRRDANGQPLILEVNARFGAHAGNAPELLAGLLADAGVLKADLQHQAVAE